MDYSRFFQISISMCVMTAKSISFGSDSLKKCQAMLEFPLKYGLATSSLLLIARSLLKPIECCEMAQRHFILWCHDCQRHQFWLRFLDKVYQALLEFLLKYGLAITSSLLPIAGYIL
jgi:hypothetical protein